MMNALYITSLVAVGLLIVALAGYLLTIAGLLFVTRKDLKKVSGAIAVIADRTAPVGPVLGGVNADLSAARDALVAVAPPPRDDNQRSADQSDVAVGG